MPEPKDTAISMSNPQKTNKPTRIYRYVIGIAVAVILFYIIVYLCFAWEGVIPVGIDLTKGDWLSFFGT